MLAIDGTRCRPLEDSYCAGKAVREARESKACVDCDVECDRLFDFENLSLNVFRFLLYDCNKTGLT